MTAGGPGTRDPAALRHALRVVGDIVDEVRGRWSDRAPTGEPSPGSPGSPGAIRLSDAERDAAAAVLRDAYAEGRLDLGEFEDRLTVVHDAKVRADLPPVLADLPGHRPVEGPPPAVLTAVLRELRRTGVWELPPSLTVLVRGGTALLDLRLATSRSDLVEIDVRIAGGRVVVIVPDTVDVEVRDGPTLLGTRSDATMRAGVGARRGTGRGVAGRRGTGRGGTGRGGAGTAGRGGTPAAPLPRVVVGGEVVAGQLIVRRPTRRERRTGT